MDNAMIEVSGPELPILDGSAKDFFEGFLRIGTTSQNASKKAILIKEPLEVNLGGRVARVRPASFLSIQAEIEWPHPVIGRQSYRYDSRYDHFSEIADSRTFGFVKHVEAMRAKGLIQGGSLDSAIVLDDEDVLNPDGLRSPDEFVRHKVLDAMGDFRLAGCSFRGAFELLKSGHEVHCELLKLIFSNPSHYEVIELKRDEDFSKNDLFVNLAARNRLPTAI